MVARHRYAVWHTYAKGRMRYAPTDMQADNCRGESHSPNIYRDFCFLLTHHSGLCDPKRNRKISKKRNVAIKRVKSNALVLALSSDSNINEVNYAKVSKNVFRSFRNVEFLEVPLYYFNSTTSPIIGFITLMESARICWILRYGSSHGCCDSANFR